MTSYRRLTASQGTGEPAFNYSSPVADSLAHSSPSGEARGRLAQYLGPHGAYLHRPRHRKWLRARDQDLRFAVGVDGVPAGEEHNVIAVPAIDLVGSRLATYSQDVVTRSAEQVIDPESA